MNTSSRKDKTRSLLTQTLHLALGLATVTSMFAPLRSAEAAVRIVPRNDYGRLGDDEKVETRNENFNGFINALKGVFVMGKNNFDRTKAFFNLQWNFQMGGREDLVLQRSQDGRRIEVFACPTIRPCLDEKDANDWNKIDPVKARQCSLANMTSAATNDYWNCEQIYSGPIGPQFCEDYKSADRKRTILDEIFNNLVGGEITGQIPLLTRGVGFAILQVLGVQDKFNAIEQWVHASCSADHVPNPKAINAASSDRDILYIREAEKYELVKTQAIFRTRNRTGTTADFKDPYHKYDDETELSFGDRWRPVTLYPNRILEGGHIMYMWHPGTLSPHGLAPYP